MPSTRRTPGDYNNKKMPFRVSGFEFDGRGSTRNKNVVTKLIGREGRNRFAPETTGREKISLALNMQYFTHVLAPVIPNYSEI